MNGDSSSPAVDADGVYVSYACEQAYRFDLAGALVWHHTTDCEGGGGRTPVLHDGRVYIRDDAGKPPAVLDAASGDQVTSYAAGPAPAFDGQHMATVSAGVLTVSDTASGDPLWHAGADAVTAPLIANGYVIEGRANGLVEARHVQNGELVWSGFAGDVLTPPDEHNALTLTGLAEGDGALVVPAGSTLTVFAPAVDTVAPSVRLPPFPHAVIHHPEATAVWKATDQLSGVAVSQVRVRRGHLGDPLSAWTRHSPTTAHTATFDLRRRTRLCLAVRARDRARNWSAWSSAQCVTRRPA